MLWYGSRHYDPALGRFISPDTIVPLASQGTQASDRYAYCNNNPLRYTDPTGHDAVGDFLLGFTAEFTRVNLWFHPQAQQALSVKQSESDSMIVGSITADVVAAVVGAQEVADGVGLAGGGTVVACGTTLCMASAVPIATGGAIALQGVGTGVNAAIGIAQNAAMLGGNNPSSNSGRFYKPSPKHDPVSGWDSVMDLDPKTAQNVLDSGIQDGKQVYAYYNGKVYVFKPESEGVYHGYTSTDRVPTSVLRTWLKDKKITKPIYNDMLDW